MKKSLTYIFFVAFLVSCGSEQTTKNPVEPEIETNVSSSSTESSSSAQAEGSSSSPLEGSSSAQAERSSSSPLEGSSSAQAERSSSSPLESSSSAQAERSSSSPLESSSSAQAEDSSSSPLESSSSAQAERSSSSENSSSSDMGSSSSTTGCKTKTEDNCIYGTLYDARDGKTYKTVKIGNQEWMAENLNYAANSPKPSSYYNLCDIDDPDYCSKYGRLYSWTAAIDSIAVYENYSLECGVNTKCKTLKNLKIQGVCPENWHLPSLAEWEKLLSFVGSNSARLLKSMEFGVKDDWNGEDAYGFSVLAAGSHLYLGSVIGAGRDAYFWTATDYDEDSAKTVQFLSTREDALVANKDKSTVYALSVRCVKD